MDYVLPSTLHSPMIRLYKVAQHLNVSMLEIVGCLYYLGSPIQYDMSTKITDEQYELLIQYYALRHLDRAVPLYNGELIGVQKYYKNQPHYGLIITNGYHINFHNWGKYGFYFNNNCFEDENVDSNGLLIFSPMNVDNVNVATDIRNFNIKQDEELLLKYIINNNFIETSYSFSDAINIFQKSGLSVYRLLLYVFEHYNEIKERNVHSKANYIIKSIGGETAFVEKVKEEYSLHKREYISILDSFKKLDINDCIDILLSHTTLSQLFPKKLLISYIKVYKGGKKNAFNYINSQQLEKTSLKAIHNLNYCKELNSKTNVELCEILRKVRHEVTSSMVQYGYDPREDYSDRDIWDAMTDGQYGDYPDDGFDGDYEFMGY